MPGYTIIYRNELSGVYFGRLPNPPAEFEYHDVDGVRHTMDLATLTSPESEVSTQYFNTYHAARKALADYFAERRARYATLTRVTRYRSEGDMRAQKMPKRLVRRAK